jgi:hypothetical protein
VPRERWFHTGKGLLPRPLIEELEKRSRKPFNKNEELLTEKFKGLENGNTRALSCCCNVRYNSGPRIADEQKRELASIGQVKSALAFKEHKSNPIFLVIHLKKDILNARELSHSKT